MVVSVVVAFGVKGKLQAQVLTNSPVQSTYLKVGVGDLLSVSVLGVPSLQQTVRVSDVGDVGLMLIGSQHLAGLTPQEAELLIAEQLKSQNYLRHPEVSVLIQTYGTQGISVLGQVKNPAVYDFTGARRLLDVLSQAGGLTDGAAPNAIIRRRNSGAVLTASLSNEPDKLLATNIDLEPGDTVFVPKAGIVYVIGDVARPGGVLMQNSGGITVLQALSVAGGANSSAAYSKTKILHKSSQSVKSVTIDLKKIINGKIPDIALDEEDTLYVPISKSKSIFKRTESSIAQSAMSSAIWSGINIVTR